jgi:hypothetical protein
LFFICSSYHTFSFHSHSSLFIGEKIGSLSKTPTGKEGLELELPDFDELFRRIDEVSPLARLLKERGGGGFDLDDESSMKWKTIHQNSKQVVREISKIDNFQNLKFPLLRFRSSLTGLKVGEKFANLIMDLNHRKHWDDAIVNVKEIYSAPDLQSIQNNVMGGIEEFGNCVRLGVGYTQTKANLVASSREQLTMCGVQEFPSTGGWMVWGTELEDRYNYLFPTGKRHTRARSHLFSVTLLPTGPESWDVEYLLQLDTGGKIPAFLTTPVVIETVKSCFKYANSYFLQELEYSKACA